MTLETYLMYLVATTIVLMVPGPTILLVVSYGLSEGRGSVLRTAPGVVLGDVTCMTFSFLGLGALLAASGTLFMVLKWLGALYLIWLGLKMWRSRPESLLFRDPSLVETPKASRKKGWTMFAHCYAVTATNPKGIVFFTAFLPQFIDHSRPMLDQMAVLGGTFLVLAFINAALYGYLAGSMRRLFSRPSTLRTANRVGGGLLIGAGLMTAAARRA